MKRISFLLKGKENKTKECKKPHKDIGPEIQEAMKRKGWHNNSLFMCKDDLLFDYFETPQSFQDTLNSMAKEEINTRRQDYLDPYFESIGTIHTDEMMLEHKEIFHLD